MGYSTNNIQNVLLFAFKALIEHIAFKDYMCFLSFR